MQRRSGKGDGDGGRMQLDEQRIADVRCNGELQYPDYKLQYFPWRLLCLLWTIVIVMLSSVPYLAKNIPPTPRSDIKWWMTAVVYQVKPPNPDDTRYIKDHIFPKVDELDELGIKAIRISNFFESAVDGAVLDFMSVNPAYGTLNDFLSLMEVLVKYEMQLIIDVPLAYTSTRHRWFIDEEHNQTDDSVYIWNAKLNPEDHIQSETYWRKNDLRQEYYQHVKGKSETAVVNYSAASVRGKMQSVFKFWIQLGVSGFVLLNFDSLVFAKHEAYDTKCIRFEHSHEFRLRQLGDLTQTFRSFLDEEQERHENELDILMALDVSNRDEKLWHTLYESGADLILNKNFSMSTTEIISPDVRPLELYQEICDDVTLWSEDDKNTQHLISLVQLLLPGAAFVCEEQLPHKENQNYARVRRHLTELMRWRSTAAMSWGQTQLSHSDRNVFSFVRYTFGKMYSRYIVIANFSDSKRQYDFTMNKSGLLVPSSGTLRFSTCSAATDSAKDPNSHAVNSIVHLNDTHIEAKCGLVVELNL